MAAKLFASWLIVNQPINMKVPLWALLLGSLAYGFVFSLTAPATIAPEKIEVLAQSEKQIVEASDPRVAILEAFFDRYNSPLKPSAAAFINAADLAGLDYRMLPAVAGVESGFGKALLPNSFNPFGWGGGYIKFESFDDAAFVVGLSLKTHYVAKGADTVEKIAPIYCPPNAAKWSGGVRYFMLQIANQ